MDAIKFIKERNRMCAMYTSKRCEGCPADNYGGEGVACIMIDKIDAERLIPIVEEWSAAHPYKTRQSVFLKQWPNAMIDSKHILSVCPQYIDSAVKCARVRDSYKYGCADCRADFWGQEIE